MSSCVWSPPHSLQTILTGTHFMPILPLTSTFTYRSSNEASWTTRHITLLPSFRMPLGTPLLPLGRLRRWYTPLPSISVTSLLTNAGPAAGGNNRETRVIAPSTTPWNGTYKPPEGTPGTPPLPIILHHSRWTTLPSGRLPRVSIDPRSLYPLCGHRMSVGPSKTSRRLRRLGNIFAKCSRRSHLFILTTSRSPIP